MGRRCFYFYSQSVRTQASTRHTAGYYIHLYIHTGRTLEHLGSTFKYKLCNNYKRQNALRHIPYCINCVKLLFAVCVLVSRSLVDSIVYLLSYTKHMCVCEIYINIYQNSNFKCLLEFFFS